MMKIYEKAEETFDQFKLDLEPTTIAILAGAIMVTMVSGIILIKLASIIFGIVCHSVWTFFGTGVLLIAVGMYFRKRKSAAANIEGQEETK